MIFVALGSNLPSPQHGGSREVLEAALAQIEATAGIGLLRRSSWYRSAPWPPSDQPFYINGVAEVSSDLTPGQLMSALHAIETAFGRMRSTVNEARVLDLDLIAYHDRVSEAGAWPVLPHPRLAERAFVLRPLVELAPRWRHPVSGVTAETLLLRLGSRQSVEPL